MQCLVAAAGRFAAPPACFLHPIKHLKTKARPSFAAQRVSASAESWEPAQRITSTGNAFVKHCVKLRTSSKHRLEAGAILLVGSDLLQEAAGATVDARLQVRTLILGDAEEQQQHAVGPWLVAHKTVVVTEPVMRKIVGLESAASIDAAAEIDIPKPADFLRDWPQVIGLQARGSSPTSSGSASLAATSNDSVGTAARAGSHAESLEATELPEGVSVSGAEEQQRHSDASSTSHPSTGTIETSSGSGPQGRTQDTGTHSIHGIGSLEEQQGSFYQADAPSTSPSSSSSSSSSTTQSSSEQTAQGTSAQLRPLRRLLALDGVQDPGNLGTLIRSALAFGWDGVFLLHGCCSPFNDKAIKSSRGAVLRVAIGSGTLADLLQVTQHHGLHLIAADPEPPSEAQSLQSQPHPANSAHCPSPQPSSPAHTNQQPETHQHKTLQNEAPQDGRAAHHSAESSLRDGSTAQHTAAAESAQHSAASEAAKPLQGVCLVLGSEGHGLSSESSAVCTPVAIPMAGRMESLNVGIAGGILMWALSEGGADKLLSRLRSLNLLQPLGGKR